MLRGGNRLSVFPMNTATANLLRTALGLLLGTLLTSPALCENGKPFDYKGEWEEVGPNVRIMRHDDGSRTEFRRSPDDRTLTKKTTGTNGIIMMTAVYRMDSNGNPRGCAIFDGKGTKLYIVSYGYHTTTGQLVAEDMFDARAHFLDKKGRELPVRRLYYSYDAQGNRSKAQAINPIPGKTAEEVFGGSSTFPHENPFKK